MAIKEKGGNKDMPTKKHDEQDQPAKGAKAQMLPGTIPKEFFNPKSMLTPGLCGGVTMLITNALAAQFGAPPNYTGLIVSCLFGLIVFAATATVLWLRFVFWVLNSLIIFSIALGSNQIGVQTSKRKETAFLPPNLPLVSLSGNTKNAFFANWLDGTVPKRNELVEKIRNLDGDHVVLASEGFGLIKSNKWNLNIDTNSLRFRLEQAAKSLQSIEGVMRCSAQITFPKNSETVGP
jgi:hypothetical protein